MFLNERKTNAQQRLYCMPCGTRTIAKPLWCIKKKPLEYDWINIIFYRPRSTS